MKVNSVNTVNPMIKKTARKGIAIAAGIAIGVASGAIYNAKTNASKEPTSIYYNQAGDSYTKDFNNLQAIKEQGKTKHLFAAQDGPDKGSRYYKSSEYDFFGHYKK